MIIRTVTFGSCCYGEDEDYTSYTDVDIRGETDEEINQKIDKILDDANKEPGFSMWISYKTE